MTQDDLIAAYLRDVDALLDTDDRQRQRVLSEIDGHLRDSAAEHADRGASTFEAVDLAIREFGAPEVVAAGFATDLIPASTVQGVRRWLPALLPTLCFVPAVGLLLWSLTWVPGGRTLGQEAAQATIIRSTAISLVLLVGALWAIRNADRDPRWRVAAWSCSTLAVLVLVL